MSIKRSNFSPTKIDTMLKRYGHKCAYCGTDLNNDNFTVDHIIPKSKGGSNHIDNLNGCCLDCNWMKGNMTVTEFRTTLSRFTSSEVVFHMDPGKKKKVFCGALRDLLVKKLLTKREIFEIIPVSY